MRRVDPTTRLKLAIIDDQASVNVRCELVVRTTVIVCKKQDDTLRTMFFLMLLCQKKKKKAHTTLAREQRKTVHASQKHTQQPSDERCGTPIDSQTDGAAAPTVVACVYNIGPATRQYHRQRFVQQKHIYIYTHTHTYDALRYMDTPNQTTNERTKKSRQRNENKNKKTNDVSPPPPHHI